MNRLILTISFFIFLFTGCSKYSGESDTSNEMKFLAEHPNLSKVTSTGFENGDEIGVFVTQYDGDNPSVLQISGNYSNNNRTTFNGRDWISEFPIYWSETKFDVYAYFPYMKLESVDQCPFSIATDQTLGYESSDFLWAKTKGINRMEKVPLRFKHKMSKLVVLLKKGDNYEGEFPSDILVKIHNTVTDATIDLSTGTVIRKKRANANTINARKVSIDRYEAIIVPQRIENRLPLIEILTQGISYLVDSRFIFREGMEHIYTIILNGNPDQVKIEIGGEIEGGWQ